MAGKRESKSWDHMEIDLKHCTSITYDFDKKKLGRYEARKPKLCELLEWNCLQAKLGFFSRAKTFLGIRVAVPSWTEAYVAVSEDKLYFFKSIDELDRITDFTFDLEDCLVHDVGEAEGRHLVFQIVERRGAKLMLAAEDKNQYLTFARAIRHGCSQFMLETVPFFEQKANIVKRSLRKNVHRRRYLRMKRGFIRLQAVFRGRRARKEFSRIENAIVIIQSFARIVIAKNERDLLRLKGNVQKYQMIRTYTFQEIVQTEDSYVKDLDTLLNVFMKPMRAVLEAAEKNQSSSERNLDPHSPSLDLIVSATSQIMEIRNVHTKFLAKLREQNENWSESCCVGPLFLELADELDVYVPFCTTYESVKKNFELAKKNDRLRELLEVLTPGIKQVKKLDIFGFFIQPIQRVPRYSLLLSDLLKRTWKDHPDYHSLAEAVLKMQTAGSHLNETRRKAEEKKKTETLIQKFKEPTAIQELLSRSTNTACIYEGPAVSNHLSPTEDDPKKYVKAQVFLFSDQLVLAKKNVDRKIKGSKLKIWSTIKFSDHYSIPLVTVSDVAPLTGTEAYNFGFMITMGSMKLKIFPQSSEARDIWVQEINQARKHAQKDS